MIKIKDGMLVHTSVLHEETQAGFRKQCEFAHMAVELLARARAAGVVLNIDQAPLTPLAIGNHVDVVTVHAARVMAGKGPAA